MKRLKNKIANLLANNLALLIVLAFTGLCAGFILLGTPAENGSITLDGKNAKIDKSTEDFIKQAKLVMAKEAKKALITINGADELIDVPTVESIDSGKLNECPDGQDCGQGWYVPTDTIANFKNATFGRCIDTDGAYGSQCWDLANLFWKNYAGRGFNTCGTGAAKGTIQNGCWQKNAGSEFEMVWDKTKLQAGDWVITSNGTWGHVGVALGGYNNGYVALFGTNQGGAACSGGGSTANIINMSLNSFAGAFRPKIYNKTASNSTQVPKAPENAKIIQNKALLDVYIVQHGDTLGGISLNMGWWPSANGLYGDNGYTQRLADFNNIKNRGLIYPNQQIRRLK